jgi:Cft2 family RNA processing exonuclease
MARIAISLRGGTVTGVYTDIDNLEVHVLDHDVDSNETVEIDGEKVILYPADAIDGGANDNAALFAEIDKADQE